MRPYGSPEVLAERRRRAVRLVEDEGLTCPEVAEVFEVTPRAVRGWVQRAREGGEQALDPKPHHRPAAKLNDRQREKLWGILERGAIAYGFSSDLWTCPRVALVVQSEFQVEYDLGHLSRILRGRNLTPQKPQHVPRERDPQAIEHWRLHDWPRIKKGAKRSKLACA